MFTLNVAEMMGCDKKKGHQAFYSEKNNATNTLQMHSYFISDHIDWRRKYFVLF